MRRESLEGFAVDIGGTKTAVARISGGEVEELHLQSTDGTQGLDGYLDTLADTLEKLGWKKGKAPIGVTVTGRVTQEGAWSPVNTGTLSGIEQVPLAQKLRDRFGAAHVSNDAAATALAEYLFGAGQGATNFVYITISTGVGGGIIVNGNLLESGNGLAGHMGFTTARASNRKCGCDRVGTVESIASGRAIAAIAQEAGHPDLTAHDVFAAARQGERWANEICDRSAAAVAELCANVTAILDPDCIALGGSIGLSDGYLERVCAHRDREPVLFRRPIVHAALGSEGPLMGALAHGVRD